MWVLSTPYKFFPTWDLRWLSLRVFFPKTLGFLKSTPYGSFMPETPGGLSISDSLWEFSFWRPLEGVVDCWRSQTGFSLLTPVGVFEPKTSQGDVDRRLFMWFVMTETSRKTVDCLWEFPLPLIPCKGCWLILLVSFVVDPMLGLLMSWSVSLPLMAYFLRNFITYICITRIWSVSLETSIGAVYSRRNFSFNDPYKICRPLEAHTGKVVKGSYGADRCFKPHRVENFSEPSRASFYLSLSVDSSLLG